MPTTRSWNEIKDLLRIAKLDESYSCGPIQTITFSPDLCSDDYRIFEVDNQTVDSLLQRDSKFVAELKDEPKPNSTGRVFLCTEDKTYSVIEAETSNSLLFVSDWWLPPPKSPGTENVEQPILDTRVQLLKSSYYELHDCVAPSLRLLKQFLRQSTYHGPVEDSLDADDSDTALTPVKNYNFAELKDMFPCNSLELNFALRQLRTCELRGYIRIMDTEYLNQVLRDIFACADENGWNWRVDGFPVSVLLENLKSTHDGAILKQILPLFFGAKSGDLTNTEMTIYPRNSAICRLIGEHLLSVTNSFDLTDFMSVWRAAVPDGLRPKLRKHLTCAGRAFTQRYAGSTAHGQSSRAFDLTSTRFRSICSLCAEDLPDDTVESRLTALFERCAVWPEAELASYIVDLLPSDRSTTDKSDAESNSDFEYADAVELDGASGNLEIVDVPKSVPPAVGSILNKFCRMTSSKWGRFYTEKHAVV